MKKLLISLIALLTVSSVFAQEKSVRGFVFPKFIQGEVIMKNGSKNNTLLNYDAAFQKMIMKAANGEYFYLGDFDKIAAVMIDGRKFVPSKGDVYLEEIPLADNKLLYKQNRISIISKISSNIAYGAASQTTATESASHLLGGQASGAGGSVNTGRFNLLSHNEIDEIDKSQYLLYDNGEYIPVMSVKNVISVLGHKDELTDFAKKNKIKFNNQEDVVKIIEYGYSL